MDAFVDFHDAILVKISREGADLLLHIEFATVGASDNVDEWENQDGTLRLCDVVEIRIDGTPAADMMMEGSDASILSLEFSDGRVAAFMEWETSNVSDQRFLRNYEIVCAGMTWHPTLVHQS